nr:hypothetical protein [Tanacetum cinerariifolium]
ARVSGLSWGRWGRVVGIVWSCGEVQELGDVVLQVVAGKTGEWVNSARLNWEGKDRGIVWDIYIVGPCDGQAQVWKSQRSVHGQAKVKSWKLLESCGVHIITFTTTQLILLVERRYPLLRFTLDQMLNAVRLRVEEQSEMSLELLSTIPKKESDEVIKSSVEYFVPILSESKDTSGSDRGDVDEINAFDNPSDFKDGYYDLEGDVLYLESLLSDETTPNFPPEVFLDRDPISLSDINDLQIMVKVFNPVRWRFVIPPISTLISRRYGVIQAEDSHKNKLFSGGLPQNLKTLVLVVLSIVHSRDSLWLSKEHIEVLLVLWGNRLLIPDG